MFVKSVQSAGDKFYLCLNVRQKHHTERLLQRKRQMAVYHRNLGQMRQSEPALHLPAEEKPAVSQEIF